VGYIFFFSLSKCLDDAQSFLGYYVLLTKPSLRIIFPLSRIMCTYVTGWIMMHRRQWIIITRVANQARSM